MDKNKILEVINEVFRDFFDDQNIVVEETTTADDIKGWDSLAHITLMSAIADSLEVEFDMDDLLQFSDIGTLVEKAVVLLK